MRSVRLFFILWTGSAIAAACGGSTNNGGADGGSGEGGSSGNATSCTSMPVTNDAGIITTVNACTPCGNGYCAIGEYCCMRAGGVGSASCVASMSACTNGTVMQCTGAAGCGADQVCCSEAAAAADARATFGGAAATNTVCENTACPAGATQLCTTNAECGDGGTCSGGGGAFGAGGGGGMMTCQAPACTGPASCGSGEVCCTGGVGGFGGGAARCQAASDAGACSGGESVVCAQDSDCPSGQTCAAAGAGVGFVREGGTATTMTCQTPACTAASGSMPCASGRYCCGSPFGGGGIGGGGGAGAATGTCQMLTSAGACPGPGGAGGRGGGFGVSVLCSMDSDCPVGQTCNPGMSFGGTFTGAMTCGSPAADSGGGTMTTPPTDAALGG